MATPSALRSGPKVIYDLLALQSLNRMLYDGEYYKVNDRLRETCSLLFTVFRLNLLLWT